ncbi:unnamed protein product [Peronospora belbahrii]|uniref:Secreted protein n=1 Tax=Peronospora belbahrii TaxID=622444 RepID=A0AAU9KTA1_9STRA|nr:unnamed protein product [Peronospora belbahrii]
MSHGLKVSWYRCSVVLMVQDCAGRWKGVHFSRLYGSCVTTPQAAHMTNGQLGEDVTCAFFSSLRQAS